MFLGFIDVLLCIMFIEIVVMIGLVYILLLFMIFLFYLVIEKLDGIYIEVVCDFGVNKF